MLPELELFGLEVHSYYLFAALAAAWGTAAALLTLKKAGLGRGRFALLPALAAGTLVGARLWNYAVNPLQFGASFSLWQFGYGHFSLYGGLAGAFAVLAAFALLSRKSLPALLDALVLPGGGAIVLLKIGCFLNGCCFGKAAHGPFGLVFPANRGAYAFIGSIPLLGAANPRVYPTQLFEAAGAGLGLVLVFVLLRKKKTPPGTAALAYTGFFTLVRLLVHPLRAFSYGSVVVNIIYPAVYGVIISVCGAGLWLLWKRKSRIKGNNAVPPDAGTA